MSGQVSYTVTTSDGTIKTVGADWADTENGVLRLWKFAERKVFNSPDSLLVVAFGVGKWTKVERMGE